jgi:hypothetical protein
MVVINCPVSIDKGIAGGILREEKLGVATAHASAARWASEKFGTPCSLAHPDTCTCNLKAPLVREHPVVTKKIISPK